MLDEHIYFSLNIGQSWLTGAPDRSFQTEGDEGRKADRQRKKRIPDLPDTYKSIEDDDSEQKVHYFLLVT
jgi:hypothetical protein